MKRLFILLALMPLFISCSKSDNDNGSVSGSPSITTGKWQRLGGSFNLSYTNEYVWAIAIDPSDNVYISQDYDPAGNWTPLKYNGVNWSKVGTLNSSDFIGHYQMQFDASGSLYMSLNEADVIPNSTNLTYIAKFNGSWNMVGNDDNSSVSGVSSEIGFAVTPSGKIYASFLRPLTGSVYTNVVWNGSTWDAFADNYFDAVSGANLSCNLFNGIYHDAFGNIYTPGTTLAGNRVFSKFDGTNWQNIGFPFSASNTASVKASCYDASGNIYFIIAYNSPVSYSLCKWNGSSWSVLTGLSSINNISSINCMAVNSSGKVYVGGELINSSGNYFVAEWNGTVWSELGGDNSLKANGAIYALSVDSKGNVYAGGEFTNSVGEAYVAVFRP